MSHIKEYWDSQAVKHNDKHDASWGDNWAIDLEIEMIRKYIAEGDKVLDVGCANGYSAFKQLDNNPQKIYGIDYSEPMIDAAKEKQDKLGINTEKLEFEVGDILDIQFDDNLFDVVYTTRVLINLPTWSQQIEGINECLRVCKPGGKVILSEGFWEPLAKLNTIRLLFGLSPLVEHDFNRYIKEERLNQLLADKSLDYVQDKFSAMYYLGSRVLREVFTDPTKYPGFSNPINEQFYSLQKQYSGGDFGIQQAYVITKS